MLHGRIRVLVRHQFPGSQVGQEEGVFGLILQHLFGEFPEGVVTAGAAQFEKGKAVFLHEGVKGVRIHFNTRILPGGMIVEVIVNQAFQVGKGHVGTFLLVGNEGVGLQQAVVQLVGGEGDDLIQGFGGFPVHFIVEVAYLEEIGLVAQRILQGQDGCVAQVFVPVQFLHLGGLAF